MTTSSVDYDLDDEYNGGFEDPVGVRLSLGLDFLQGKLGLEVFGQSFGNTAAETELSGPGIGDPGDVFTVSADASSYDFGIGGRIQVPIVAGFEVGGRAGLHYWEVETSEDVWLRTASGQTVPISGPINVNGELYGGGEVSDDGVDGYVAVNALYRWPTGFYLGAEYGYFPMSVSGGATADFTTLGLMVGYAR